MVSLGNVILGSMSFNYEEDILKHHYVFRFQSNKTFAVGERFPPKQLIHPFAFVIKIPAEVFWDTLDLYGTLEFLFNAEYETCLSEENRKVITKSDWKEYFYLFASQLVNENQNLSVSTTPSSVHNDTFAHLANFLPGVNELISVSLLPCNCYDDISYQLSLKGMIIHLNDKDKMSREKIADWLDDLHDQGIVDIEFKVKV